MLYNSEASLLQVNQEVNTRDGQTFGYALNENRAKAKLLKGAKRVNNLDVEVKSRCVNLRFSDGSYFDVILVHFIALFSQSSLKKSKI